MADDTGAGRSPRGRDRDTERGDIREGGSGRDGCGSTHRDRLNSRAARLFFQRSFFPPSLSLRPSLRCPPSALPAVPSRSPCSLVAFLFSTPLRAVPSLRSPFSALLLLHQRWQPAYRQSSFSILRGAAPPPPSLSPPVPGIVLSLRHVCLLPFLFFSYLRCVAP